MSKTKTIKKLTFTGLDSWSRATYQDDTGESFVMVDEVLHEVTDEGEPLLPVNFEYTLTKKGE